MRRIASLAVVAGLVWLLMSFIAIKDAQAGWFGANVDPACPGGTTGLSGTCPTAYEGCFSWALFYNAQNPIVFSMTPFYDGNGNLAGYTCPVNYVPIENGPGLTEPTCTTGHEDASVPSGCSDFVAPSPEQLGICTRCTNNHGREAAVVDPVDLATGNVFEEVTDYSSAGPDKLEFKRYYNSQSNIL